MSMNRLNTIAALAALALSLLAIPTAWVLDDEAQAAKSEGIHLRCSISSFRKHDGGVANAS